MEKPKTSPAPVFSPGTLRLLLAVAASAVLLALSWAGLQVRSQQARIRQLEAAAKPAGEDHGGKIQQLEQQLAEQTTQRKQAAESAAARETELQGVITFLRNELKSANEALDRLKQQGAGK